MRNRQNNQTREVRTIANSEFRVDRADEGPARLVGHAAVFNQVGDGGWFKEKINPGAFTDAIRDDDIRALFNHNPDIVLGRNRAGTLKLSEDERGLVSEIYPPDTQAARDLLMSVERGDINQMSFAFTVVEEKWERGEENEPDMRTLLKVRLYDVSPVTYPFYSGTDVAVRSHDLWRAATPDGVRRRESKRRRLHIYDMAARKVR